MLKLRNIWEEFYKFKLSIASWGSQGYDWPSRVYMFRCGMIWEECHVSCLRQSVAQLFVGQLYKERESSLTPDWLLPVQFLAKIVKLKRFFIFFIFIFFSHSKGVILQFQMCHNSLFLRRSLFCVCWFVYVGDWTSVAGAVLPTSLYLTDLKIFETLPHLNTSN